jgi:hypothetical protein
VDGVDFAPWKTEASLCLLAVISSSLNRRDANNPNGAFQRLWTVSVPFSSAGKFVRFYRHALVTPEYRINFLFSTTLSQRSGGALQSPKGKTMELLHAEADLKIWRIITPDTAVPARVVRYLMGSLGFDTYRVAVQDHAYWRL